MMQQDGYYRTKGTFMSNLAGMPGCLPALCMTNRAGPIVILLILVSLWAAAQRPSRNVEMTPKGPFITVDNMKGRVEQFVNDQEAAVRSNGILQGSAFIDNQWNRGYIVLANGLRADSQWLRFNAHDNQIWFRRDSQVLVLETPARELRYEIRGPGGKSAIRLMRCGYPPWAGRGPGYFYEVLVDGPRSLLKSHTKRLLEKPSATGVTIHHWADITKYFLFDSVTRHISTTGLSKKKLQKAMPLMEMPIRAKEEIDNLKIRSEADLIHAILRLNENEE